MRTARATSVHRPFKPPPSARDDVSQPVGHDTSGPPEERQASDLTARARIRDAAIECFAEDGFEAGFRAIAARAGVSPGLITHHFGSKAELRGQCDQEVLRRYHSVKSAGIAEPRAQLVDGLTDPRISATVVVYMLRAILAGGPPAQSFLERLTAESREVMAESVAAGIVRPSRDEEARLRYLTYQTMGALLVHFVAMPRVAPAEFVTSLRTGQQDTILPMLELFTEGLLTSHDLLDEYLEFRWQQAGSAAAAGGDHSGHPRQDTPGPPA